MANMDVWANIQSKLSDGMTVKNWTSAKGYLGDSFTISKISANLVSITSPGAENELHVPRQDFEKVFAQWAEYCAGSVQRQQIRDTTRFSKYIISIFHQISV